MAVAVPILLAIFGFTMCGVRVLSCAACWQSSVGNVEAGSCFSCLQSVAAKWCQVKSIGMFLLLGLVVGVTTGLLVLEKTDVKYFDMDHAMTSGAECLKQIAKYDISCLGHLDKAIMFSGYSLGYISAFILSLLYASVLI